MAARRIATCLGLLLPVCRAAEAAADAAAAAVGADSDSQGHSPCAPGALEVAGDVTADAGWRRQCLQCRGRGAQLQYVPKSRGGGYTTCSVPDGRADRSEPQLLPVRAACGEGSGDVRGAADGESRCRACEGPEAALQLMFIPFEGSFRTECTRAPARRLSDSAAACTAKALEVQGDATAQVEATENCQRCLGKSAQLQYVPFAADGGFTTCSVPDGRGERSLPQAVALRAVCGEGHGDTRSAADAAAKCAACEGRGAALELLFLPWEGARRTVCRARPLGSAEEPAEGARAGAAPAEATAQDRPSLRGAARGAQ